MQKKKVNWSKKLIGEFQFAFWNEQLIGELTVPFFHFWEQIRLPVSALDPIFANQCKQKQQNTRTIISMIVVRRSRKRPYTFGKDLKKLVDTGSDNTQLLR